MIQREIKKLLYILSTESVKSKLKDEDVIAINQAVELTKNGKAYVNNKPISITLKVDFIDESKQDLKDTNKKHIREHYVIDIYKDNLFFHFNTWISENNYMTKHITYRYDQKNKVNELSTFTSESEKHVVEKDDYLKYFEKLYSLISSPNLERVDFFKSKYISPYYFINISPLDGGLKPKTNKQMEVYDMTFQPNINSDDFNFSEVDIPDNYLTNKPDNYETKITYNHFLQLLNEAAGNDDVDGICRLWNSAVKRNLYAQTNNLFPGILIASCRIFDEEGGNGSEWHNVGIIITKSAKKVVLTLDRFDYRSYEYIDVQETDGTFDSKEIMDKFRKIWKKRVDEFSGLEPHEKIFIDRRKKIIKQFLR